MLPLTHYNDIHIWNKRKMKPKFLTYLYCNVGHHLELSSTC